MNRSALVVALVPPEAVTVTSTVPAEPAGAALTMPVEAEQDWPPGSPPAGARHDTLLDHAYSGHAEVRTASHGEGRRRVRT